VIAELLPAVVASAECFDDPSGVVLFDEERAVVARAVDKRRREFATVRHCARRALAALGHPPVALLPGRRGAPLWPDGIVGSMTHCDGYRAAALARADKVHAVGIDAEPDGPLPDGVLDLIARPDETTHLADLRRRDGDRGGTGPEHWERLLFSCKETVFKVWYPLTHRELDFHEASIRLDPRDATFTVDLLTDRGDDVLPARLAGRWIAARSLIISTITLMR
jgi:4'-phosphopantetheinyl transferase EntD